ncbi:MAG: hypothetical protein DMF44_03180 [Verrucomicrobia bacterium]|nr:MAG: hypothetical protein DMF44_03180 [Verrucomicrobiota bacterium]
MPVRVNDGINHQNNWHWFGTFAVASNGRLEAVWYDNPQRCRQFPYAIVLFVQHGCHCYVVAPMWR